MAKVYKVKSKISLYPGMAGWHFLHVDKKTSSQIKEKYGKGRRGFGSIPVIAAIKKNKLEDFDIPRQEIRHVLAPSESQGASSRRYCRGRHRLLFT